MKNLFETSILLLNLLCTTSSVLAASPAPTGRDATKSAEVFKACQTRSPNSGSFFDLSPIRINPPDPPTEDDPATRKARAAAQRKREHRRKVRRQPLGILQEKELPVEDEGPKSWHARGHDYPSNFTLNICGPVVEDIKDVVGISNHARVENVSAYYAVGEKVFSLGETNGELVLRGRKLTLNYTHGSPCPKAGSEHLAQDDPENWSKRHKSTLISLLCERDPLAPKAAAAFVGTIDECTYFFEVRSSAACPAVQADSQKVGPSGVFGVIFGIAFLVYIVGGVVYQRTVMHQRGWRQLPNYALWHGIVSFIQDFVVILFSSCARCLGARKKNNGSRGYNQVGDGNGFASDDPRHRGRSDIDDNRLIDELEEEWHN